MCVFSLLLLFKSVFLGRGLMELWYIFVRNGIKVWESWNVFGWLFDFSSASLSSLTACCTFPFYSVFQISLLGLMAGRVKSTKDL